MGKKLTDLTERTATANTDLLHVNSGGTDYKESKANFTSDLAKEISFSTSSTLTSQIDALEPGGYYGFILSYGHQSATGMPYDVNFFISVQKYDANNCTVHAIARGASPRKWSISKANSWGSWIEDPSRSEITKILTKDAGYIGYRDFYKENIVISSNDGYSKICDVYNDANLPSGSFVLSFYVRGWSGSPGAISLLSGSDGRSIYVYCGKAGTIGSVSVRIWYVILWT